MAKLITCHDGGIKTGCYTLIEGWTYKLL